MTVAQIEFILINFLIVLKLLLYSWFEWKRSTGSLFMNKKWRSSLEPKFLNFLNFDNFEKFFTLCLVFDKIVFYHIIMIKY